jgi:flagellar biosynthetic protein FlhB
VADEGDSGERTEPATPRKREEAREKGQVAKSGDLNSAVILLGGALVLYALAGRLAAGLSGLMAATWEGLGRSRLTRDSVVVEGEAGLLQLLALLAPVAGVLAAVALAVNILQVGFRVSWKPLEFDLTKLDPMRGAKRIISRRGATRLAIGLVKLGIVGWVLWDGYRDLILTPSDRHLSGLLHASVPGAVEYSVAELFRVAMRAGIALLVLAILDFSYQRWQHDQDLRMTKQEVREEMKRMEGDPKLKERRRRLQQRLALQRMMHDVPTADVVITNPTHYACALRYDEKSMTAPRLVAKGQDLLAHRIRELAVSSGVPVVEEPALARAIHRSTEIGQEIPPDLYQPVAEVLSYVYRASRRPHPEPARSER